MYDLELPRISGFPSIWIFGWANPLEFHAAWGQTKSPNFLIILTQRTKLGEVINNYHMFRWSWWYNVSSKQFEKKQGVKVFQHLPTQKTSLRISTQPSNNTKALCRSMRSWIFAFSWRSWLIGIQVCGGDIKTMDIFKNKLWMFN